MRVLLAYDGSPQSKTALDFVVSVPWPQCSLVEVLSVIEPVVDVLGFEFVNESAAASAERTQVEQLERELDEVVERLQAKNQLARSAVLVGRPGRTIIEEAHEFRAELLVVGSRGRGSLRSALLGSVSAEVVDHAPCPVIVARRPTMGSVLVAVDNSVGAYRAIEFLAGTRLMADRNVEVLSVASAVAPGTGQVLDGLLTSSDEAYESATAAARRATEGIAAEAARQLNAAGAGATWSISRGDPGREIVDIAGKMNVDLVAMGTRGHTGLARLVLGSVARHVTLHATASVLVVREPLRERNHEFAENHGATYAMVGSAY